VNDSNGAEGAARFLSYNLGTLVAFAEAASGCDKVRGGGASSTIGSKLGDDAGEESVKPKEGEDGGEGDGVYIGLAKGIVEVEERKKETIYAVAT
jgi:hypothetical protein